MKIIFIDTVYSALWDGLLSDGHECVAAYNFSREQILTELPTTNGIVIRSRITIDKEILNLAKELKFIARAGAGLESIDCDYANEDKFSTCKHR